MKGLLSASLYFVFLIAASTVSITQAAPSSSAGAPFPSGGRPWHNVMAFGAKNDNSTNDTDAFVSAIAAACGATVPGGIIYLPAGAGYLVDAPIDIACDNLQFVGAGWSTADWPSPHRPPSFVTCPRCSGAVFANHSNAQRFGIQFANLGISSGGQANPQSQGINLGLVGDFTIENVFFDQTGGPALLTAVGGLGGMLLHNFAQNCMLAKTSTPTGCFDLGNSDTLAYGNFASGLADQPDKIGTGNAYGFVVRGNTGFYFGNEGDQNQQGWLITGAYNSLIGNRSYQPQGSCFVLTGGGNTLVGNKCIDGSQTRDGAYSAFVIRSNSNVLSDNYVDNDGAVKGNRSQDGFVDANSHGSNDTWANSYSNNRVGPGFTSKKGPLAAITGVVYNFTGTQSPRVSNPTKNAVQATTNPITLVAGTDGEVQLFTASLSSTLTVTLSSTGAWNGARFRIVRTGGGNGVLSVVGHTLAFNQWIDFEFIGGAWTETAKGSL